jgi:hypothetical protein
MYVNRAIPIALIAFLICEQMPNKVGAEDRYYLLMFASQSEPNVPRLAHSFATFVKTVEKENAPQELAESHTISWLPENLSVELVRFNPVRGTNLNLSESIRTANSLGTRVTMWGPVRIKKELYDMAIRQVDRLNRGEISYIAMDRRFRGQGASNCFHAVSDLDTMQPALNTGTAYGDAASQMVFEHFTPHVVASTGSLRWIADRLKLKPAEIRFATLDTPRSIVGLEP